MEFGIGLAAGFACALAFFWAWRARRGAPGAGPRVYAAIEEMRAVGHLSVFKIVTKEIVAATDHWLGDFGKRYLQWIVSARKMAMIIAFEIDFRYDLRSPDFQIHDEGGRRFRLVLPRCLYETRIKDVAFYDEQNSKLFPWLLPDLLNRAFGAGFSEEDKNRLIEEAKQQATHQAGELVHRMQSEAQASARRALEALARGFGAQAVTVEFRDTEPVQTGIEYADADRRTRAA